MNILMVCARFLPFTGGTEQHVHEVGRRMVERGHRVTVLTTDREGSLPVTEVSEGMRVVRCPASPTGSDLYWSPRIWHEIVKSYCDLVHVQGWHSFVAPTAMAAAIRHKRPFVLTFHSGGHSSASRNAVRGLQTRLLRPLARRAKHLIGVSRFEADYFSEQLGIARDRFEVIGNGAQMPAPRERAMQAGDAGRLLLSVGRLERYKGHHRVIEALPLVLARMPDVRLRVAGDGPYEADLRALVARLGLGDKVVIGKIPPSERDAMADVMARSSLVTLISEYEAHPVAVMEAVSLGTPVLTTDTSGFIELAEQGLVRTVPLAASTEMLAQAIMQGVEAPRRPIALKLPDWEDCTSRLLKAYDNVLSQEQ